MNNLISTEMRRALWIFLMSSGILVSSQTRPSTGFAAMPRLVARKHTGVFSVEQEVFPAVKTHYVFSMCRVKYL